MPDLICPFSATLVKNDFACHQAEQIIRRGGAEIACLSEHSYAVCHSVYTKIKSGALAAMDLEDDLLSLPHSVLVRIQFGGLLALQAAAGDNKARVDDIATLIERINELYRDHARLPFDAINACIADYKISRRSRK